MNNELVIIGGGVVGNATAEAFGIDNYYDIDPDRSNVSLKGCVRFKYIFICLPTPTINSECYTKDIYDTVKQLKEFGLREDAIIIIRSTVPPGFNRSLQEAFGLTRIVSNPEFLSEDTSVHDATNPDLIVVGSDSITARDQVIALYKGRFKYPDPVETDSVTAEFIKYSLNVFFATKVIFANQLSDAAQDMGANYEKVRKVLETHKWGSKGHFQTWHKNGRGAGGRCLPKDLESFGNLAIKQDLFYYLELINNKYLKESEKK